MSLNVADISRYQDTSVIPALRGGGTDAIIVGVTFGCAGNNPIYTQQLTATSLNGMLRGAYHIRARVNWTPQEEGDFFLAHMTGYLDGRTILVLDWEECDTSDEAWALAWLQYVEAKTGIKPWFYVNLSDLLTYKYPRIAANGNAIWLAQYPYSTVNGYAGVNWQPQAIPAGHTLAAWQYVGTGGTVNGVTQLDLSVAYITADGWLAYASSTSTQSGTITPIQEDLVPNATDPVFTSKDGATVSLQDLLNSIDAKVEAARNEATNAKNNAAEAANRISAVNDPLAAFIRDVRADLANKGAQLATVTTALGNVPAGVLNQQFPLPDGTKTNLAGILAQINAKPATVTNNTAAPALDVDALVARLKSELPPIFGAKLSA